MRARSRSSPWPAFLLFAALASLSSGSSRAEEPSRAEAVVARVAAATVRVNLDKRRGLPDSRATGVVVRYGEGFERIGLLTVHHVLYRETGDDRPPALRSPFARLDHVDDRHGDLLSIDEDSLIPMPGSKLVLVPIPEPTETEKRVAVEFERDPRAIPYDAPTAVLGYSRLGEGGRSAFVFGGHGESSFEGMKSVLAQRFPTSSTGENGPASLQSWKGNSGGPAINLETGKLVGLVDTVSLDSDEEPALRPVKFRASGLGPSETVLIHVAQ